jgi:NADH-quinone oxidoreductase subunit L
MTPTQVSIFIFLLPLVGAVLCLALGKKQNHLMSTLASIVLGGQLLLSVVLLNQITIDQNPVFEWFKILDKGFSFGFLLNGLTLLMLALVSLIATLVALFSGAYLSNDPHRYRYFGFLLLFVFAMVGLVLTDNLLVMYAFWELVGLSSYLLIGFWFSKPAAAQAAKKAFIVNRIGDVGLLIGVFLVYQEIGSFQLLALQEPQQHISTLAGICLFMGAMGKSAQFPLHVWLPDAMEGPTPVSALIHAATMVAAGVFLAARVQPALSIEAMMFVAATGSVTMLLGAFYAIFQTDIKKVLAYSTISQLGLMFTGLGTGLSVFHLFSHAFFKAGLFLAAGSVIHSLHHSQDPQDIRLMGGLRKYMPVTCVCFGVGAYALMGLPLSSGFLSKDLLIASWVQLYDLEHDSLILVQIIVILLGVFLTAFYMSRLMSQVFLGEFQNNKMDSSQLHESPLSMTIPMIVLALFSFFWVFSTNPFEVQNSWFFQKLSPQSNLQNNHHWIGWTTAGLAVLGCTLGYFSRKFFFNPIPTFDLLYEKILIRPVLWFVQKTHVFDLKIVDGFVNLLSRVGVIGSHVVNTFDKHVIDGSVNLVARLANASGGVLRLFQNGQLQMYILWAILGLLGLILWWV